MLKQIKEYSLTNFNEKEQKQIEVAYEMLNGCKDTNIIEENIAVTNVLLNFKLSSEIIIASLLKSLEYDNKLFNETVNSIVIHSNALNNFKVTNTIENDYEDYRNMLVMLARDYRVLIIELAERLFLMRKFRNKNIKDKKQFARETLHIYAPLAHRLGIGEIKEELEELSLYFLDKEEFLNIEKKLELKKDDRANLVNKMINEINNIITNQVKEISIFGRSKSIYSIYKKTNDKEKSFDELFDLQAIRIICNTVNECYTILGIVHAAFPPISGRFKDYVAVKKPNLYQSLHTSVIGVDHKIFEIQIRTHEMDEIAECGIAAHWTYKEESNSNVNDIEEQLHLFRDVINSNDTKNSDEIDKIQESIFESTIYCFTPNGKIITLPKEASAIDFAYRIHSKIAEEMVGVQVNGRQVPYETILENGDIIEIKTRKGFKAPNSEWLKYTKTAHASRKIKAYLRQKVEMYREEEIQRGKEIASSSFKKKELMHDLNDEYIKNKVMKNFGFSRNSDLYIALANKKISIKQINDFFKPVDEVVKLKLQTNVDDNDGDVYIKGAEGIKKELALCCNPIYGDRIMGVIVSGVGIKIHRLSCNNINEKSKLIDADWIEKINSNKKYTVELNIFSEDRDVLLNDFVVLFGKMNIGIQKISSNVVGDYVKTSATILVIDANHLNRLIDNISKIKNVVNIDRIMK
ncbi:MAG: RelA/SpoT family protein [Mycoplasmatales bacterium]